MHIVMCYIYIYIYMYIYIYIYIYMYAASWKRLPYVHLHRVQLCGGALDVYEPCAHPPVAAPLAAEDEI